MSLVINEQAILEILKREIPKLFSPLAHEKYDFENLQILLTNKKETTIHKDHLVFVDVKEKSNTRKTHILDSAVLEQPPKTTEFLLISEHKIEQAFNSTLKILKSARNGQAHTFPINELTTVEQLFKHVVDRTAKDSILMINYHKSE